MALTFRRNTLRTAFTLVELLVVVAIFGLILAFAVPRMEDIGRGSKMRAAISELRSTISLARQWAITYREEVFLVFPDDISNLYSGLEDEHKAKALRSYAVYSRSRGYIKDWVYLPAGVFFVDQYNQQNTKSDARLNANSNVFRKETLTQLPFPFSTSVNKAINAIRFLPDGTAAEVSTGGVVPFEIYVSEGVSKEGSGGKVINIFWKENPVLWGLKVNALTGGVKLTDYSI